MSGAGEFMQRLRNAAVSAVSEDDMREIFRELVTKAKRGDLAATRLLLNYVLPPNPQFHAVALARMPKARAGIGHRTNGLLTHDRD